VNVRSEIGESGRAVGRGWRIATTPGLVAIAAGVVLATSPDVTALISLWGSFALAAGLATMAIGTFTTPIGAGGQHWRTFEGVLGIVVGVVVLVRLGLSAQFLTYVIAAWAIAAGVLELVTASTRGSEQ